jgi:ribonuclease J
MKLTIHQGAATIGGNCIEVQEGADSILLDIGLPLDGAEESQVLLEGVLELLDAGEHRLQGVLLSHPHIDHYGMAKALPRNVPVFCGEDTSSLVHFTSRFLDKGSGISTLRTFKPRIPFTLGPFRITALPMDHSAFDSYGFLLESTGGRLFYTGDFRDHGRKGRLLDQCIREVGRVDILITEATLVGSRASETLWSEDDLLEDFLNVFEETEGITLVTVSGQNIDRLVTLYKAARKARRTLVLDLYTAIVLDLLKKHERIPQPTWAGVRVAYSRRLVDWLRNAGLGEYEKIFRPRTVSWADMRRQPGKYVFLARASLLSPMKRYLDLRGGSWIYSLWPGYLERKADDPFLDFMKSHFLEPKIIHTSGHAGVETLKKLVEGLDPGSIIPVHTLNQTEFCEIFWNVLCPISPSTPLEFPELDPVRMKRLLRYIPMVREEMEHGGVLFLPPPIDRLNSAPTELFWDFFLEEHYADGWPTDYNRDYCSRAYEDRKLILRAKSGGLRQLLTYFVRGERFCGCWWEAATRDGFLLNILERFSEISRD